jgi:hypothetical protein
MVELGLAQEQQVMPAFHRLWELRDRQDLAQMANIQADLREQFLPVLSDHGMKNRPY